MIRTLLAILMIPLGACAPVTAPRPHGQLPRQIESAAPSAHPGGTAESYAGRITSAIKPNIMLAEHVPEDSTAEVEVRTEPSGRIVEYKLSKSSGSAAWDSAVLRAVARTERLPLDINGKVPALLYITFRPR